MHDNIPDSVKVDARSLGVDLVTFTELPDCFGLAWDVPTEEICQACPARTECFTIFPRTIARVRKEAGKDIALEDLAKKLETSTQAVLLALGGSAEGSIDAMLEVVPPTKPANKKVRKKRAGKKAGKKRPPPGEKKDPPLSNQPEVLDDEGGGPVCQACGGEGEKNDEPCPVCTGVGHQEAGAVSTDATTADPGPSAASTAEEPPLETTPPDSGPPEESESTQGIVEYPKIAAAQVGRLQVLLERGFTLTEALTRVGFDVIAAG